MNNKARFSNRVDTYVKYRPSYPAEVLDYLYDTVGFQPDSTIADVGAGTGIFTRLLLERGSHVIGVEPNDAMRDAMENLTAEYKLLTVVAGSAEQTGLPDASVNGVVCAQAFHWFDRDQTRSEFQRIIKPSGKVALIWNSRMTEGTAFLERYEKLHHTYGIDYMKVNHRNITFEGLRSFFKADNLQVGKFNNSQRFNFEDLSGRLVSSSYIPVAGHANYEPMMQELRTIFDQTQESGFVTIAYRTEVYWGEV